MAEWMAKRRHEHEERSASRQVAVMNVCVGLGTVPQPFECTSASPAPAEQVRLIAIGGGSSERKCFFADSKVCAADPPLICATVKGARFTGSERENDNTMDGKCSARLEPFYFWRSLCRVLPYFLSSSDLFKRI